MTVSLPAAMIREVEVVRKAEHRTRSELIREALRTYFTMRRTYTPTASELRAIERGRAAVRRGEYVTVDDLGSALGTARKQARSKKRPARTSA
jgi:predicted transcriptional regulator